MKRYIIGLCTIVSLSMCSCKLKDQKSDLHIPTDTIGLENYKEFEFHNQSRPFLTEPRYVNLEKVTGERGNHLGLIDKIIFSGNKIYILDKRAKKVVVFDSQGKFVKDIGQPGDTENIADIDVDDLGNMYVLDGTLDRLLLFDTSGVKRAIRKLPFEADVMMSLPNKELIFGLSSWNKHEYAGVQIIKVKQDFTQPVIMLRYDDNVDDNFWISSYRFFKVDGKIFYSRPNSAYLYELSGNGKLTRRTWFNFGKLKVPEDEKKDVESHLQNYYQYRTLARYSAAKDSLVFGTFWDKRKYRFYMLNKGTKELFLQDNTKSNILSNFSGYLNGQLFSFIYPGEYDDKNYAYLPESAKVHLKSGGVVLCLLKLPSQP